MRHLTVIELAAAPLETGRVKKISFSNTAGGHRNIGQVRRARAKSTSARRRRRHQPPPRQCRKKRAAETDQRRCVPPHHGDRRGPPSTIGATHGANNTKRAEHADRAQPSLTINLASLRLPRPADTTPNRCSAIPRLYCEPTNTSPPHNWEIRTEVDEPRGAHAHQRGQPSPHHKSKRAQLDRRGHDQ